MREIPISKQLFEILKELNRNTTCEYVVCSHNGKQLQPRAYQKSFENLLKKLKIKHYGFHSLRHTFATRLLENKVDVKTISELMGHASPTITITVYNSVNSDYVREATDRLNMKIQEHNIEKESEEQEKAYGKNPTLTEMEHTPNVEIPTPQNVEEVNEYPTVNEMPNKEDDEDELTDEEIDRMIRALERKKKRKEKDFEM